ncbi:MAG: hypothetical protein WEA99_13525, partial [Brumimicrobium sp.]
NAYRDVYQLNKASSILLMYDYNCYFFPVLTAKNAMFAQSTQSFLCELSDFLAPLAVKNLLVKYPIRNIEIYSNPTQKLKLQFFTIS